MRACIDAINLAINVGDFRRNFSKRGPRIRSISPPYSPNFGSATIFQSHINFGKGLLYNINTISEWIKRKAHKNIREVHDGVIDE